MPNSVAPKLNFPKRLALAVAGVAAVCAPIALCLINAPAGSAQSSPAGSSPISYVSSVRLNTAVEPRGFSEYSPGGRLTATAITVGYLLRIAYRIQDYQLIGAPAWFDTRRYDIAAKADDNPPPSQQVFLQALLKDRFKLALHNETRELPTFALELARSDGRLGPKLQKSDFDCAAYTAAPHPFLEPGQTPACATRINFGMLSGKSIAMTRLATSLAPFAGRFTIDKTGLAGSFDVELTWAPEQVQSGATTVGAAGPAQSDSSGPSIFTAIQDQLGLKLVSEKGPVDVLVVDHAEEPSGN